MSLPGQKTAVPIFFIKGNINAVARLLAHSFAGL